MVKRICITMPDRDWIEYFDKITSNRSAYIIDCAIKGIKLDSGEYKVKTAELSNLRMMIRNKEEDIRKLKLTIENLKEKIATAKSKPKDRKIEEFENLELSEYQNKILEECRERILKKPGTADGNHKIFRNETGIDISFMQFNQLIRKIEKDKENAPC